MSDIVKICKIHGELTKEKARIRSPNNISCNACARLAVKKHRKLNKEKLLLKEQEYRNKNRDRLRKRDREYKAKDYAKNKEKYIVRAKRFYKNNIDKRRNYRLKKLYGITLDQYNQMLINQNFFCKMCKKPESVYSNQGNKIKDLSVDHCHKTGIVRGLLCSKCNCLIGYADESLETLQEGMDYLKGFLNDKSESKI